MSVPSTPSAAEEGADQPACAAGAEPAGAFPYRPPDDRVKERYRHIFEREHPLGVRLVKVVFDKVVSIFAVAVVSPIFVALYMANLLEGVIFPDHRGSLLTHYKAVSRGKVFNKYKIRVIKAAAEDRAAALRGEWQAAEWSPESRTYVGVVAKRLYLDEIPQLFSVLTGKMSMVGPRPLAVHHYERDLAQGNVSRKLIKAGLLGPAQAMKGTSRFGAPEVEYDYIDKYMKLSSMRLLMHDLKIIFRCGKVVLQAKGL